MLSCGRSGPAPLRTQQRFLDLRTLDPQGMGSLRSAAVRGSGALEVRDVSIHGDRRASVVVTAPCQVLLRTDAVVGASLRFAVAVRPVDASLRIRVTRPGGAVLHEETWQGQRDWEERSIELEPQEDPGTLALAFDGRGATVMLANPEVVAQPSGALTAGSNVIVYVVDCMRADHLGSYGYPLPTTPSIDALAQKSVVLDRLVSCAPWTKPSTACLFTSLLPAAHRACTVDDALSRDLSTLAESFQDAGYSTVAFVANQVIDPGVFFFNQGFDRWVDVRSFEERSENPNINSVTGDAAEITAQVLPWLERNRDRRFFAYLHSIDLHYTYRPRPPFDRLFVNPESRGSVRERQLYDNELAYNDNEIGKLVAALERLELLDDTLLLVTADHGEEFGEHGFNRHGKTLYDQALHIPGVFKLPGSSGAGRRVGALASNLDIAPTLLDYAGVPIPPEFTGRSLRPLLDGATGSARDDVVSEVVAPKVVSYAVEGPRYKYVRQLVPEQKEQLFDLRNDPAESANLLPGIPAEARKSVEELDAYMRAAQFGYHLSVVGDRPGRRYRVEVSVHGSIERAFRFVMATGDTFEVSDDRSRATLEFTSDGKARHLVIQPSPDDAPIRLDVRADGDRVEPAAIRLGKGDDRAPSVPFTADAQTLDVSQASAEELLEAQESPVRVWHLPRSARRNRVGLSDDTIRYLKALGYVQ